MKNKSVCKVKHVNDPNVLHFIELQKKLLDSPSEFIIKHIDNPSQVVTEFVKEIENWDHNTSLQQPDSLKNNWKGVRNAKNYNLKLLIDFFKDYQEFKNFYKARPETPVVNFYLGSKIIAFQNSDVNSRDSFKKWEIIESNRDFFPDLIKLAIYCCEKKYLKHVNFEFHFKNKTLANYTVCKYLISNYNLKFPDVKIVADCAELKKIHEILENPDSSKLFERNGNSEGETYFCESDSPNCVLETTQFAKYHKITYLD